MQTTAHTSAPLRGEKAIVTRTAGRQHGPVKRLVSPAELGETLKPFVFLDYFDSSVEAEMRFSMHPHSGLATTTVLLEGEVEYEDTTGASGIMPAGGVEWMNAGRGVWHDGRARGDGPVRGYQLWVALPPELELGAPRSQYLSAGEITRIGPVRVILGRYGSVESPVPAPPGINYLLVRLSAGEQWQYTRPAGHNVAWLSIQRGALRIADETIFNELVVFGESEDVLTFTADEDSEFVIGSAVPHPHNLVLGYYSVHTSSEALRAGEARIKEIGAQLRRRGRIG
ncbi:pirin family protein [Caballeronia sp. SEWSISQ10-4 2]|uniref:pirin family protein n=1 Tax=Caballeronia sp. SEWSISQ10-4 2 TaxID=2937438 RepID=UPI00264B7FFF|nr:pirin family protein [Caballeronia sp. SEWSISQ10-4 2]MDN7177410.1 pirin family protein [Caballeronia sp. SEWSISQ10-4 2]